MYLSPTSLEFAHRVPARPEDAPWVFASWLEKITVQPDAGECRVWGRVLIGPCWLWHGSTNGKGHGRVRINKVLTYLHRWSLANFLDVPIHQLRSVDHLCRNRNCFQPLHLESVSPQENYERGDGPLHQFKAKEPELSDEDLRALYEEF